MWLTVAWLWQSEEPQAMAPGFISTACTGFFGNLFPLDGFLTQPRYSKEGLELSPKQNMLHYLRTGWG